MAAGLNEQKKIEVEENFEIAVAAAGEAVAVAAVANSVAAVDHIPLAAIDTLEGHNLGGSFAQTTE